MLDQLKQLPMLDITKEPVNRSKADELVKDKDVDAAIILPESADSDSVILIVNTEDEQGVTTQALSGILSDFINKANLAVSGVLSTYQLQFESISSSNAELNYTDFLLTGMIALSIAQGGMFGMVDLVEMQRKGLIKRLRMTPANMNLFGFSDMVMRLLFSVIQIILLSLIGVFIFGANLYINLPSLVVVFLLGALSFNALGYFFSSFSKTTEAYMGVANITSFVMMFLSGIFIPVETMPQWIQPISNVLPLTYFVEGLRSSMVYSTSIWNSTLWSGIGIMVLWGIVTFIIGSWLYKRKSIVAVR
jgi:ABC-2 type transport system permease protein